MLHNLIVPLDGSTFAEQAIPFGLEIARRSGASLELVRVHRPVVQPSVIPIPPITDAEGREQAANYLDSVASRSNDGIRISTAVLEGSVAEAIAARGKEGGNNLIVMTTHARGGFDRTRLGSVADEVVREADGMPVLLIHPRTEDADHLRTSALFRRVLIPLEDCTRAEEILEPALALGEQVDATYTLLHVITPSTRSEHYHDQRERSDQEAIEERQAMSELKLAAARMQLGPDRVTTVVVRHSNAEEAILDHATQGFDLIALATHGHGAVGRFFLGSVADKVLRRATVPVLVCRVARTHDHAH